ncbi:MAG: TonB-dependent receptor [Gammaproteobacteria bacterium]
MTGRATPGIGGLTLLLLACAAGGHAARAAEDEAVEEIVVTATRSDRPRIAATGNVARLDADEIAAVGHHHVHELMLEMPGTWISRGSGQEHLTAIRSPVLTGAGSCGAFLFLEDGLPIRPTGFCNVNQLFEVNTEQASAVEVVRGPGSALYGSNALHGLVNVITADPRDDRRRDVGVEFGPNDYVRGSLAWSAGDAAPWTLRLHGEHDGGFRDDSGYGQAKLNLNVVTPLAGREVRWSLAATDLDQETAGYILGEDAYEDPDVNRTNPNPEAYRNADAQRLSARWTALDRPGISVDLTAYARRSAMEFLQHFLPGQPLERNGQVSAGLNGLLDFSPGGTPLLAGADLEWSDGYLRQTQAAPITDGPPFLAETRPAGKQYDYDVTAWSVAPFVHWTPRLGERVTLELGLRLEHLRYDYDNRMISGNTRDDGTPCGFGGCLYTRPADRSDDFTNLAPKIGVNYRLDENQSVFASLRRGFRAPQATELYRLQSGQEVADLDSERVDSLEIGYRRLAAATRLELVAFLMDKEDSVLRDAEGFNVSGGASRHVGLEIDFDWLLADSLTLSLDAAWTRQTYEFDLVADRGETFTSGNLVDTAPRTLGNLKLRWEPLAGYAFTADLRHQGSYYLDAENQHRYPGHELLDVGAEIDFSRRLQLRARLNNVADRDYADRADYAFGNYRYFPGRGREFYVALSWRFGDVP